MSAQELAVGLVAMAAPKVVTLTEDADELHSQIINHEDTYLDLERVEASIRTAYVEHEGTIPDYVRDRHITAIGRIASSLQDEVIDSGFMTRREFSAARTLVAKYVWQEAVNEARGQS